MGEQIQKLIPKQRQRTYEHTQNFPAPELPHISDELIDKTLEAIDEAIDD